MSRRDTNSSFNDRSNDRFNDRYTNDRNDHRNYETNFNQRGSYGDNQRGMGAGRWGENYSDQSSRVGSYEGQDYGDQSFGGEDSSRSDYGSQAFGGQSYRKHEYTSGQNLGSSSRGSFGNTGFGNSGYQSRDSLSSGRMDQGIPGFGSTSDRTRMDRGFSGKGPKDYKRSDERIREEVCDMLTHDSSVDASEIDVRVEGGVVTLTGTVEDRRMKRDAEDCIEHCRGIHDVRNELKVKDANLWEKMTGQEAKDASKKMTGSTTKNVQ